MPTVAIEGTRFYYEEQGAGTPMLVIHGTGGDTSMFADVARRLASSRRVITYDRRGFSRTEAALPEKKEYLRRHADDAAVLLRELGAPRATVFGSSMGGVVALALAVRHPDCVARLVLHEPPLHLKKRLKLRTARKIGGAIALGKLGMHRRGARRFFRYTLARRGGGNSFDELDPAVRNAALANARPVLAELDAGTGEELTREDLASIRCPIGLIIGGRSAPFLVSAAERCADLFPSARVIRVPGGDHLMQVRQPDVLASTIAELVEE